MSNDPLNLSNSDASESDNRQELRLPLQLVVFLERTAAYGTTPASIAVCQTQNISANGLSVITDQMLTPDTIVRACVQTLDYRFKGIANVAHVNIRNYISREYQKKWHNA